MKRTWTDIAGGNWSDPKAWSPTGVPGSADAALITRPGTYSLLLDQSETAARLVLADSGATLLATQSSGRPGTTLDVTGGIGLDAGTLALAGSVQIGQALGGNFYTLYTPTALDLSAGLDTHAGGAGTRVITAAIADLNLIGSQTLDHATLDMGDSVALAAAAGTLTLGAGFTLEQTGTLDTLDGSLVNRGRLQLNGASWTRIGANQPGNLTNTGTIAIGHEEVLATGLSFANTGLIQIGGALDLTVSGSFANTGTIALAAGATFDLNADTTLRGLGRIANAGGTLAIDGTLDLGAGTLTLARGGAFGDLAVGGTLRDGTIRPAGGALSVAGGTFDAITYAGTLDLSALGTLTTLDVMNGLSVQGGTVDVTGIGDALQILDSETLDHLMINLGATGGGDDALRGNPAGTLALGPRAVLNAAGGQMTVSAEMLLNEGRIAATGGALSIAGTTMTNAGSIEVSGKGTSARLQAGTLSNSGGIAIGAGDTLVLQSVSFRDEAPPAGFTNTGTITVGPGSDLVLDTNATLAGLGAIRGSGGTLEIAPKQTWFESQTGGLLDLGGGTLVIGGDSSFSDLIVDGTIENGTILVEPGGALDPASGAAELSIAEAPCYLAGSRLMTTRGEVAVEHLAVGDDVMTASGAARPIVWIGERRIDGRHKRPELIWPVRIRAQAFGPDRPKRDLLLSPDHAVSVPGTSRNRNVLIPIKHLANGLTVVQEPAANVHYFHVELESHDVLLAEGLPAESYLDTGNRRMFANGGKPAQRYPVLGWENACAPLREEGPEVAAVRKRLAARAARLGWRADSRAGLHLLAQGRAFPPASIKGRLHRFVLPAGTREVTIISHSAVRSGGGAWRRLGICVCAVVLNGRVIALDAAALGAGFHPQELGNGGAGIWTDGAATLSLGAMRGPVLLELLVEHGALRPRYQPISQMAA